MKNSQHIIFIFIQTRFWMIRIHSQKKVFLPTLHSYTLRELTYDITGIELYLEMTLCNKYHRSKILYLYFALS